MSVDRRHLFRILGAGAAAGALSAQEQHNHAASAAASTGPYAPRALSAAHYASLERLLDILLPADDTSPGAREAGAARYIDTTLHFADERTKAVWKTGLDVLTPDNIASAAENETNPTTEADRFFVMFKQTAIQVYYQSAAGRKALGYKGDTAIRDFAGCTHADHKVI